MTEYLPGSRRCGEKMSSRKGSVEIFKKRRLEASSHLNSVQLNTDDDKLSTTKTSDNKSESIGSFNIKA